MTGKDKSNLKAVIALSCMGALFLFFGIAATMNMRAASALQANGKPTIAVVIGKLLQPSGRYYGDALRYRYSVNHQSFVGEYDVSEQEFNKLHEGDTISILYLDDDPKTSGYQPSFEETKQLWQLMPCILLFLVSAFVVVARFRAKTIIE